MLLKKHLENNLILLLLVAVVAGFFAPDFFGKNSDEVVLVLIASLIFSSCSKIEIKDLFVIDVFGVALFSFLRFALLPLICFYIALPIVPEFAEGVLLLALMPAGVAVTALCAMSGGSAALGLGLTVISSLMVPAILPGIFSFLGHVVEVDVWGLFITICQVVFIPTAIYFALARHIKPVEKFMKEKSQSISIFVLAAILFIIVASQKENFTQDIDLLYSATIVMVIFFGALYLFGFVFSLFFPENTRTSYIFASGAMNNALAVGLAFSYFGSVTILFIVLSEIIWSAYVVIAQYLLSKKS